VLGPAGRVHCTLADWGKFVTPHMRGAQGRDGLLKATTFRALHTPPKGEEYAGGWLVLDRPWAGGKALNHGGCNTAWYAVVWIAPKRDFAVLVATNCGGDEDKPCDGPGDACDGAVAALIEMCEKRFLKK
jgi:CubicO group peptidase (beta-lactamase class C family)